VPTLEIHMLHQLPPSLINRDEDGQPKTAHFGGAKRARWSSQSAKRAMRLHFGSSGSVPVEHLSARTRKIPALLTEALVALGHNDLQAHTLAVNTVWGAGLLDTDPSRAALKQSNVLLLISDQEIQSIARRVHERADELLAAALPDHAIWPTGDDDESRATARKSKKERKADCPAAFRELGKEALRRLDATRAADIALFGRMMAQAPEAGVDGALHVAHAIGTHSLVDDLDYYTAVDDHAAPGEAATGFLDTASLTSAVFYRYHSLQLGQLSANLAHDDTVLELAVAAALNASVYAMPTAKQTSTAPWTRPSLVLTVLRLDQPLSLANAFSRPVRADYGNDLVSTSARALAQHWGTLGRTWGHDGVIESWHTWTGEPEAITGPGLPGRDLPIRDHLAAATARALLHTGR
jgi:CRISPR system Cascade subunit CasC